MKVLSLLSAAMMAAVSTYAQHEVECSRTSISSNITSNTTLSSSVLYQLEGCIHVTNGHTLTIPAGTRIMGQKSSTATLIIDKGAQLVSQGTSSNPVIFTSNQQPGYKAPGDWGGITVLGYATNNASNSITLSSGRACSVTGGGTDDNDNSGVLKYMRLEYPASFTLLSVGDATEFHDVQVLYASQNALELYGGTVNFNRFASLNAYGNDLLVTNGNRSKAQYILGLRLDPNAHVSSSPYSNGIVIKNNDDAGSSYAGSMGSANTHPIFSNVTLLGAEYCGASSLSSDFKNGILMTNNAEGGIYNSYIDGWQTGFRIESSEAIQNANNNATIKFAYNSFYNNSTNNFSPGATWSGSGCTSNMPDWLTGSLLIPCRQKGVEVAGSQIGYSATVCGTYSSTPPDFSLSSSAVAAPNFTPAELSDNDDFFVETDNRGAFDATDWTAGWANWYPSSIDYCVGHKTAPTAVSNTTAESKNNLTLAPNPAGIVTYASFTTAQAGSVTITVTNSVGQTVRTYSKELAKGNQKVAIQTEGLSTGMYIVNVELQKGTVAHSRLIVK